LGRGRRRNIWINVFLDSISFQPFHWVWQDVPSCFNNIMGMTYHYVLLISITYSSWICHTREMELLPL
jgi:hypothetical protein